jgi:uncharacterized protein YkwD
MKKSSLISKARFGFAVFAVSAVLAACGGGGGGSSDQTTSTGNQAPAQAPQAASLMQPATTAQTASASGDPTADGIAFLNAIRHNVGFTTSLVDDATLKTVSKHHTDYLVANVATGHFETAGLPGYTGQSPFTRGSTVLGEVVIAGNPLAFPTSLAPVQDIFDAPYHRFLMLGDWTSMGVANTTGASWQGFNIDFGGVGTAIGNSKLVAYPYSGQTDVPTQWFAAENPNPFASAPQYQNTYVGYPVTVHGAMGMRLTSVNTVLTDDGGNIVMCQQRTADNDTELSNGAMCIPFFPLKAGATYSVHVTGVLTGYGAAIPVDLSWQFKTVQKAVSKLMGVAPQQRPVPQF